MVNFPDTNVVLGVQWLYSIGDHILNYQIPEMKFQYSKGVLRVVRGQHTYPNQVVTRNCMKYILRHGDIEWAAEFHIKRRHMRHQLKNKNKQEISLHRTKQE